MSKWSGVIAQENQITGDGRFIELNALTWDTLPIPFRWVESDVGAHDGAVVVGKIETITRATDGGIEATGTFDLASDAGREAARQVTEGLMQGVSIDMDEMDFEVWVAKDLVAEEEGIAVPAFKDSGETEDGRVKVAQVSSDDEVMRVTAARIRAATLVAVPAFEAARIDITDEADDAPQEEPSEAAIAAGGMLTPPDDWFTDPGLKQPSPITVTDDGRVFGHLAAWDTCHVGMSAGGQCVQPPLSMSGYAYFRTGSTRVQSGSDVPTGVITLDTTHPNLQYGATKAMAHYDNTGTAVADVVAGEDQHGIWVAGALRSTVTDEQVRVLRGSPLSGDWRRIGGSLELVAALAVNVPGFPVPHPKGVVASGELVSLAASGVVNTEPSKPLRFLRKMATEQKARSDVNAMAVQLKAEELAREVRG